MMKSSSSKPLSKALDITGSKYIQGTVWALDVLGSNFHDYYIISDSSSGGDGCSLFYYYFRCVLHRVSPRESGAFR
jgi:hypothetical protein